MDEEIGKTRTVPVRENRLEPIFWGAGLLFGAFLCSIRFVAFEDVRAADGLFSWVLFATVGGLIAAVSLLAWGRSSVSWGPREKRGLLGWGMALSLAGALSLLGAYLVVPIPFALTSAGAALMGAGLLSLAVVWGSAFSCLEPEKLLPNGAAALVVACLAHNVQNLAGAGALGVALVELYVAASAASLRLALAARGEANGVEGTPLAAQGGKGTLQEAGARLWLPLFGACISCFIFGLIWNPIAADELPRRVMQDYPGASLLGPALMALAVATVCARDRTTSPLRLFDHVIYPIAVALLLVVPVVSDAFPETRLVTNILSSASFAVVALCVWCTMASTTRARSSSPLIVFPLGLLPLAVSFIAGLFAIHALGTAGRTFCLVLLALYLTLIAISFSRSTKEDRESRDEPHVADDNRSYIHRRCDALATAFELSPRESEVLYYLGRGYNHTYIAKKLYISENTVRTHVRHIYSKLGISSREELIDLVDGE